MAYLPVRCFTCNKPVGHLQLEYEELYKDQKEQETKELASNIINFFEKHNITRYCCRTTLLGHPIIPDYDYTEFMESTTKKLENLKIPSGS